MTERQCELHPYAFMGGVGCPECDKGVVPIPKGVREMKCSVCQHRAGPLAFYFVWYPGCPGPEPAVNPEVKCPECGSKDIEES